MTKPRRTICAIGVCALAAFVVAGTACGGGEDRITVADRGSSGEAELQQALDEVVAAGAPGALVLVRAEERTVRLASGYGNLKPKTPLRIRDRFRVGSVTKTFVATVVLQLVDEGKLALDNTVERWLPGLVSNGRAMTLRQLLNMTSGLFDYLGDGDKTVERRVLSGDWNYRWKPRELVAISTAHKPKFAPGAGWSYCNTCYILLGLIIEKATGNPITIELQRRVFTPAGLRATSLDTGSAISGPHARGYELLADPPLADVSSLSSSFAWTAGAIVSTADDLARFYRALLRGKLLRPDLRRAMLTTVDSGQGFRYGLGLGMRRLPCGPAWGHAGGFPGYHTWALSSEDGKRQVVVFVNREDSLPNAAGEALERVLATAYCGSRG
jgi:D-alanyl-D-alanine carboxypeptidase